MAVSPHDIKLAAELLILMVIFQTVLIGLIARQRNRAEDKLKAFEDDQREYRLTEQELDATLTDGFRRVREQTEPLFVPRR